ncbi:MAG TPA: hypothetical protein PLL09_03550 [Flavobacterium sp.]|uniref:hypothetical protein n=2 Tax=Flavobacterium TaxID=237 RepID=UPI0025BE6440|nr:MULTISPECIES: hypothetical protein [unclassified Flavobacterium]HRE76879.1 hypothetical protein [Flavobacterium sp.]
MKKISLIFILFLSLNNVYAQVNRAVGRTPQYHREKPKVEKKDPVELTITYLKEQLSLDSFQEAAVKVYLTENQTSAEKIHNSDITNDEKKLKFEEAVKDFDEKIIGILNPDQIKIFEELKEKKKSKKKKKKEEEN